MRHRVFFYHNGLERSERRCGSSFVAWYCLPQTLAVLLFFSGIDSGIRAFVRTSLGYEACRFGSQGIVGILVFIETIELCQHANELDVRSDYAKMKSNISWTFNTSVCRGNR